MHEWGIYFNALMNISMENLYSCIVNKNLKSQISFALKSQIRS